MNEATLAPGRRLSQIRQALGLSQRRVAELAGQPHSFSNTSNRVCRIVSAHTPANF